MNTRNASLTVLAAGSLRRALTPILSQFSQRHHVSIHAQFGPAGLLREQIESGAQWDLFASANQEHPQTLLDHGLANSVMPFLRNKLCLTTHRARVSQTTNWLDLLTDPSMIVGTSTPGSDPSGDYTWQLFDRVEQRRPGAGEFLKSHAKQLVGGKAGLQVPETEIASAWLIHQGLADVFVGYAHYAQWLEHDADIAAVTISEADNIFATYALALRSDAAQPLATYLLSSDIQQQFVSAGFALR
ncbi:molybdate ABC transporter substrate-binding protein [Hafnia alvei]|uniref:Molybdate transport system substrate-binding protein n=1 Tax=Hafnia alvei TaxID=569 RepID=A0A1C6Z763_HAFAL|nr:molybdate ABC transporter substrate-binding protein [Hafnia alvei]NLS54870.1 molybdate ABC transporter substrate-binding protein [Hafnia alvei]SCM54898.1 molybdate transport system substrate-binding protein [Hafnia alvei]